MPKSRSIRWVVSITLRSTSSNASDATVATAEPRGDKGEIGGRGEIGGAGVVDTENVGRGASHSGATPDDNCRPGLPFGGSAFGGLHREVHNL